MVFKAFGNARSILTAERSAINLLQTLSGTASEANRYARELNGLHTKVLDTRKTLPGLRLEQKYAAKVGGAENHRIGLFDGVLIKENHIRSAGSITNAVKQALASTPDGIMVEVEVESIEGMHEAIEAGAKRILLDNFNTEQLAEAVKQNKGQAVLEASGNVTIATLRDIAETGVDYISVGALTKHITAVDFSLQFKTL
ncbi:MAG: nicotinate-nucleotide pyrophosphorylase (carboxylating) [Gammaproteobacteria bacterium]